MDKPALQETLTVKQVAIYFNVGESTVKKAVKTGQLKSYKNGKSRRIKREWVLEYEAEMIASTS